MEKEGETSSRPDLIRSSYNFLRVVPESGEMAYGGDYVSYDDWEISSDWFDNGEVEDFIIFETGSEILLMVPQTRKSIC